MEQTLKPLTSRQTQILKALINEYIETAVAVGSEALEKKYNLGVSPATIRNEMVALTKSGYLKQLHTSAGRVPTPTAMKFYIDQLMDEKALSLADEVKAKEEVWDVKDNLDKLLNEATHSLAHRTGGLAVAATDDGEVWHSGHANIFSYPEFEDIAACANLFGFIDESEAMIDLFFNRFPIESPFDVLFGEQVGLRNLPIGIVAAHFKTNGNNGAIAVIGPVRQSYASVIPTIRYYRDLIEEVLGV